MSAGDALGSCPRRGELGHLPHPDGRPCIVNSEADRRREVPGTSVQVEELHDRIAVLEQRNGALDANAEAAKQRLARLHRDHDRVLDQLTGLERRLELEVRATKDYAEQQRQLGHKLAAMRGELDAAQAELADLETKASAGMALELAGRVYVARDLLVASVQHDLDAQPMAAQVLAKDREVREAGMLPPDTRGEASGPGPFAGELLEADGMVYVPVPKGHMLSVTVTPYDDQDSPRLGCATNAELDAERAARHSLGHTDPSYRTVDDT